MSTAVAPLGRYVSHVLLSTHNEMMTPRKNQKKLVRLISAFSDMSNSVQAANLLLSGVPDEFYGHLFQSMVVAYGRPFTENRGVGRIQCDYPNYPDSCDPDMRDRHARLLDLRNKFVAHSSAEGTRVQIVPPGVANPRERSAQAHFTFNIGKRTFPEVQFVKWLRVAPASFGRRLYSDIEQLLQHAFGTQADLTSSFELPTGHEHFQWT
jgi:hypothetical protein